MKIVMIFFSDNNFWKCPKNVIIIADILQKIFEENLRVDDKKRPKAL